LVHHLKRRFGSVIIGDQVQKNSYKIQFADFKTHREDILAFINKDLCETFNYRSVFIKNETQLCMLKSPLWLDLNLDLIDINFDVLKMKFELIGAVKQVATVVDLLKGYAGASRSKRPRESSTSSSDESSSPANSSISSSSSSSSSDVTEPSSRKARREVVVPSVAAANASSSASEEKVDQDRNKRAISSNSNPKPAESSSLENHTSSKTRISEGEPDKSDVVDIDQKSLLHLVLTKTNAFVVFNKQLVLYNNCILRKVPENGKFLYRIVKRSNYKNPGWRNKIELYVKFMNNTKLLKVELDTKNIEALCKGRVQEYIVKRSYITSQYKNLIYYELSDDGSKLSVYGYKLQVGSFISRIKSYERKSSNSIKPKTNGKTVLLRIITQNELYFK
jgi:hypothetical protein